MDGITTWRTIKMIAGIIIVSPYLLCRWLYRKGRKAVLRLERKWRQ